MKISNTSLLKISHRVSTIFFFNWIELYLRKPKIRSDPTLIAIGKDVFLGESLYISAEVDIGDRVMFGPECMIIGGDHIFGRIGEYPRYIKPIGRENSKKIIIEEDVWIGSRAILLKGVRIGKGAVIGAGSVVTKNIPPYCVSVGNPCKPIKRIFSDGELFQHLTILGYSDDDIRKIIDERNSFLKNMCV